MTALVYVLSMPGVASWNGRWSGEDRFFAIVETIPFGKKHDERAAKIIAGSPYSYAWSDGWRASVSVHLATGRDVTNARHKSQGFCGYDWMVRSIKEHGEIRT